VGNPQVRLSCFSRQDRFALHESSIRQPLAFLWLSRSCVSTDLVGRWAFYDGCSTNKSGGKLLLAPTLRMNKSIPQHWTKKRTHYLGLNPLRHPHRSHRTTFWRTNHLKIHCSSSPTEASS